MRILLVSARPPWPPYRGDQLRLTQWIEALTPRHQLSVLCPVPGPDAPRPLREAVSRSWPERGWPRRALETGWGWLQGLPAQVALYRCRELSRAVADRSRDHELTIVLLARLAPLLTASRSTETILDLVDCLSLSTDRRSRFGPVWQRPFWRLEARRLRTVETRALARCRRAVVVSSRDREALLPAAGATPIEIVPVAFPSQPKAEGTERRESQTPAIAFTGNLGYWVNRDAVRWWGEAVWPRLRSERPELRWVVAGARPPVSLARFLRERSATLVEDPPDLRRELDVCQVAVAPLRGGAGQPMKVLDAWATGTPIVVSPWTAAGLGDSAGVLVADTPAEWVRAVGSLLDSETRRRDLAAVGARRLANEWSTQVVLPRLRRLVGGRDS